MVREKEAFLRDVFKLLDFLIIVLAFFLAYYVSFFLRDEFALGEMAYAPSMDIDGFMHFISKNYLLLIGAIPAWIIGHSWQGGYEEFRGKKYYQVVFEVLKSTALMGLALGSLIFLFKLKLTSRLFIGVFGGVLVSLICLEKYLLNYFLDYVQSKGFNQINLLIVGSGERAQNFIRMVKKHSKWGLRIVGLIDDEHAMYGKEVEGFRVLGRIQDIPLILHRKVVDRVIFVVPRLWLNRIDEAILACEKEGVSTSISMDLYDLKIAKPRQTDFSGFPLLEYETIHAREWQFFIKRALDIILSLFAIVMASPIMLLIAIAIKLESRGPIFFKQKRCGLNGRQFTLYKFRSMVVNAEVKRKELEKANEMDGPVFKIKRDPRVTNIGRFIRKTSIDELPQFFNVLKGDMSLVGPRPPLPVEVDMYQLWQRRRLSLKPGVTCIWQVSGRNNIKFERWMEMDLEYIDNWSIWLDVKILFRTVYVVLTGYGAS